MPKFVIPGKQNRDEIALTAMGIISESAPVAAYPNATAGATQSVYGSLLGLRAGDVVTGVVLRLAVAAAGTLPTTARFGLADSTGKILALSGNDNALAKWTASANAHAFTAAYTVPSDGGYFACFVVNGTWGSTQPTIRAGSGTQASAAAFGSATPPGFIWTGQTDLPAVNSSLTITSGLAQFYMAVY